MKIAIVATIILLVTGCFGQTKSPLVTESSGDETTVTVDETTVQVTSADDATTSNANDTSNDQTDSCNSGCSIAWTTCQTTMAACENGILASNIETCKNTAGSAYETAIALLTDCTCENATCSGSNIITLSLVTFLATFLF